MPFAATWADLEFIILNAVIESGKDKYHNLTLVTNTIHKLIHATNKDTIERLLKEVVLDTKGQTKLNKLRKMVSNNEIIFSTK